MSPTMEHAARAYSVDPESAPSPKRFRPSRILKRWFVGIRTVSRLAWPVVLVLAFWNSGREGYRTNSEALKQQFLSSPTGLLYSPWQLLRMYVSRDSDERLYYAYTQLVRGREFSPTFIADRRAVSVEQLRIRPGSEWRVPYRDFSVEYPPLAWAAILPPAFLANSLGGYRLAFGLWMAILTFSTVMLAWRLRRRLMPHAELQGTARASFLLLLALGPILVIRYDILPAFFTLLAVERAIARRPFQAGLALGAGAMCKIYPLFLAPVFVAAWLGSEREQSKKSLLRFGVGMAASVAAILVPFVLIAPSGLADLVGHSLRPLEIESVLGTPFLLYPGAHSFHASGCINLAAPGTETAARLSGWLFLGVLAGCLPAIYWMAKADLATGMIDGCLLVLLGLLCTSKVLSAQYLIWLVPFLFIRHERQPQWLVWGLGLAMALAQVWYPMLWGQIVNLRLPGVGLLMARNLLLAVLFAAYVVTTRRRALVATGESAG